MLSSPSWSEIEALGGAFAAMEEAGLVLCLHGEAPDALCLDAGSGSSATSWARSSLPTWF